MVNALLRTNINLVFRENFIIKDKSFLKVGVCVAESFNVKKMKMLGVISTRNIKKIKVGNSNLAVGIILKVTF